MKKLGELFRHNSMLIVSIVISVLLLVWGTCCQPTVKSPRTGQQITRPQLDIEVKIFADEVSLAYSDLQKQEQIREAILNAGLLYASGGGLNPFGLATTLAGIIGMGAVVDNRRKDSVIKTLQNNNAHFNSTTTS